MRYWLAVAFLVAALVIGVWDVVATARGAPLDTVSQTMLDWSSTYPVLPLVIGIILGHTFWPQRAVVLIAAQQ